MLEPRSTSGVLLEAKAIRKMFNHVEALRRVDFQLLDAEIHGLVGNNGAGKSTFIKILAGIFPPDAGELELLGAPVAFSNPSDAQRAGIETVYQDLALAPNLDASENVYLGREALRSGRGRHLRLIDRKGMRIEATEQLRHLGIVLPSTTTPVGELSGGQRQAIAIARAAIWGHRVLVLDEPVAALSPIQTSMVLNLMRRIRDERGLSLIFVSHNMPEVMEVCDRVTVFHLGQRVLTSDTRDIKQDDLIAAMTGLEPSESAHSA